MYPATRFKNNSNKAQFWFSLLNRALKPVISSLLLGSDWHFQRPGRCQIVLNWP